MPAPSYAADWEPRDGRPTADEVPSLVAAIVGEARAILRTDHWIFYRGASRAGNARIHAACHPVLAVRQPVPREFRREREASGHGPSVHADAQRLRLGSVGMVADENGSGVTVDGMKRNRVSAANLTAADLPSSPGAYIWFDEAKVFFVGHTEDLRDRIFQHHIRQLGLARSSALTRVVAEHLGYGSHADLRRGRTVLSDDERKNVHKWLLDRDVAWTVCPPEEAANLADQLKAELSPR